MGGALIAAEALDALLIAVTHGTEAMQAINALVQQAHSEGRDLTDAELAQVIQTRKDAEAKLQAAAVAVGTVSPPPAPKQPSQP